MWPRLVAYVLLLSSPWVASPTTSKIDPVAEYDGSVRDCGEACEETISSGSLQNISLYVAANQSVYRIGDVVKGQGGRWKEDRATILHSPKFNNTLLQRYFQLKTTKETTVDTKVLGRLCRHYWGYCTPGEDLVMHHRNGDNIHDSEEWLLQCATQFKARQDRLHNVSGSRQRSYSLRLVTVQHYGANELNGKYFPTPESIEKGNRKTLKILHELQDLNFSITVQSSSDPDEDFCTVVLAHDVCLSHGTIPHCSSLYFAPLILHMVSL